MWVFDGEEWTQENGSDSSTKVVKSEVSRPRYNELMPELQVIEIVPLRRNTNIPPFPLP